MDDLAQDIRNLSAALNQLCKTLEAKASSPIADSELAGNLTFDLLDNFKNALDHSRHMVWPYVIALQQGSPENVDFALQQYRMQRVREMLTTIRKDEETLKNDAKTLLFLAEMHRMTNVRDIQLDVQ
ncbi:MAG: hypothetical protein JWN45_3348 [Acidobacteriaceae bacterium]|nr:hypothetical protein [Acidobacteriaceae bacterium]